MARTITLRLSNADYEAVKPYALAEQMSMNSFVESLLDVEDMRRRCAAHQQWTVDHPDAVSFSEAWADGNPAELADR